MATAQFALSDDALQWTESSSAGVAKSTMPSFVLALRSGPSSSPFVVISLLTGNSLVGQYKLMGMRVAITSRTVAGHKCV